MILNATYKLTNGVLIPKIGLGTWLMPDDQAEKAVKQAIEMGYRHIDTAQAYQNEEGVGRGLRASGVKRDELFVTSKIAAELKSHDEAAASIDESLRKLGLDTLDLMIIHAPQPWREFRGERRYFDENLEVWRALEEAYAAGKVRAIGVSNFLIDDLANILANCRVAPMVNQILLHVGETPIPLIEYCQRNDILIEAYSPIAHGAALKDVSIAKVAAEYDVSVARLCIQYTLQLGAVTLPKSTNPEHILDNTRLDFVISDSDMELLRQMGQDYGEDSRFPVFRKLKQK